MWLSEHWREIAAALAFAAYWGDMRAQLRSLREQVVRQNGRIGKAEDALGGAVDAIHEVREDHGERLARLEAGRQ